MGDAKVRLSMTDGVLELEGSEAFVTLQLERFGDLIASALAEKRTPHRGPETRVNESAAAENTAPVTSGLDDVFAVAGDSIQILKDIPGDSRPEKTVNAARLLLFGMKNLRNTETVLFEDVKKVCKAHGIYDPSNMAKHLKVDQASFIFGGSGKKQSLQLTVPGHKATSKLIADLQAGSGKVE